MDVGSGVQESTHTVTICYRNVEYYRRCQPISMQIVDGIN